MRMFKKAVVLALAGVVSVSGCGGSSSDELLSPSEAKNQHQGKKDKKGAGGGGPGGKVTALYAPSRGDLGRIPLPSDVLFAGTPDGSLNIPGTANYNSKYSPDAKALRDPLVALNTMDGFGVTTDLLIRFQDTTSSGPGPGWSAEEAIRIYETDSRNPWPVAGDNAPGLQVRRELLYGADYVHGLAQNGFVRIRLVKPLKPYTTYLVTVNSSSASDPDNVLQADPEYRLLQSTEPFVFRKGTEELCDYTDVPDSLSDCTDLNPAYKGELSLKQALALEGRRQVTNAHLQAVVDWDPPETAPFPDTYPFSPDFRPPEVLDYAAYEEAADHIVLSYSVTTQKAGYGLKQAFNVSDDLPVPDISVAPSGVSTDATDLYSGTLGGAVQFLDPKDPNRDIWEAQMNRNLVYMNGMIPMIKQADHAIPVLISAPTDASCTGELPVVLFQHDILRNRTDLRRVADALADICAVGVAIDLPKHGVTPDDPEDGALSRGDQERLVRVMPGKNRCVSRDPIDIGTPGKRCPSGDGFINGGNLANTRDSVRQAIVDMYSLYRALIGGALTPDEIGLSGVSLDTDEIHFVGHGYGASLGIPFVANAIPEDGSRRFGTITFNAGPGGGLFRMLDGSPVLDDLLLETIDAPKPSREWELMMLIGQTLLDSVNDFNAVHSLGLAGPVSGFDQAPILSQEIVGYGDHGCTTGGRCPDQVIPNNMYGSWASDWYYMIDFLGWTTTAGPDTASTLLAGTDPITQGTVFVPAFTYLIYRQEARAVGPLGTIEGIDSYSGLGLTEITQLFCGSESTRPVDGHTMVRLIRGTHYSLLGTDEWPAVTEYMGDQIAEWIASGGTSLMCDPAANSVNAMLRRE